MHDRSRIDFDLIAKVSLRNSVKILAQWLPHGKLEGREWVALNPKRNDKNPGSFRINVQTGRWADFAIGEKGGDLVSLAAYLSDTSQADAARNLAKMLHLDARRPY